MDVEALRAETPGCARRLHLNNAGAALLAQPTLDAMTAHLRLEAGIGGYEAAAAAQDAVGATYAGIARLLGGRADEVALFDNATHAWLDPFVAEIRSATWDGSRGFTWADGARRFESWENSYVNILGLGAAVRQALHLGTDAIGERTAMLGRRLRDQLDELPGVSTHDLGEVRCAIVTARIEGVPAADVAAALGRTGVNVSITVAEHNPLDTKERAVHPLVRFSPHYYNTEEELDRTVGLVAAIALKARHPLA
jgi:selenocysteine lyase/cysteine desulfurase